MKCKGSDDDEEELRPFRNKNYKLNIFTALALSE